MPCVSDISTNPGPLANGPAASTEPGHRTSTGRWISGTIRASRRPPPIRALIVFGLFFAWRKAWAILFAAAVSAGRDRDGACDVPHHAQLGKRPRGQLHRITIAGGRAVPAGRRDPKTPYANRGEVASLTAWTRASR
jgi:hypothetical protein